MNRETLLSAELSEQLLFVVPNWNAATFALDRLLVCRAAAQVQMLRIQEALARSRVTLPEPKPTDPKDVIAAYFADAKAKIAPVLYEVHFYFVAWANCENMLRVLTSAPELLQAKKALSRHLKLFEHYTAGRNSFEHYHDRLPGNKDETRVREVVQGSGASPSKVYFGIGNGTYQHSHQSWDISPSSLVSLEGAIEDVLAEVRRCVRSLIESRFPNA